MPAPSSERSLTLAEGVSLLYAVTDRIARDEGFRVLAIKGPVPEAYGLRTPRIPGDVDVWVEPARHAELLGALERIGWHRDLDYEGTPQVVTPHSVTLWHDRWPCTLDVHARFPGLLADPAVAFDALWGERGSIEVAGRPIAATGPLGSILLLALHALRTPHDPRSAAELSGLRTALTRTPPDWAALSLLAERTGCGGTIASLFTTLGQAPPAAFVGDDDGGWSLRLDIGATRSVPWLHELATAPWRRKASVARDAIWPDAQAIRRSAKDMSLSGARLRRARWRRLRAGLRDLPRAAAVLARSRRRRREQASAG